MLRVRTKRKEIFSYYDDKLSGLNLVRPMIPGETAYNYSYYPVLFSSEEALSGTRKALNEKEIFPRRYFYPNLTELPYVKKADVPVSDRISKCIICLPLYHSLSKEEIDLITRLLLRVQTHGL